MDARQNPHKSAASYILEGLGYFIDFALPFGTLTQHWFFLHYVIVYGFLVKNLHSMEFYHVFKMPPKTQNNYRGCRFLPVDARSLIFYMCLVL